MASGNDWDYQLTERARDDLRSLDAETAERVVSKLEEVVNSPFRSPPDWLEPLEGTHYKKLRVGDYRALLLVITVDNMLEVHHIAHRSSVYDRRL